MKNVRICDRIALGALTLSVILGMCAFIPGGIISTSVIKGYALILTILVAFVAWLSGRLLEGAFHIVKTPLFLSSAILLLSVLVSAFFSHTPYLGFFGEGFEQGTFSIIGSLLLGMFLAVQLFNSRGRVVTFLQSFFVLYVLLAIFQVVHIFFPSLTAFGILFDKTSSPIGLWGDFSFISGAALVGFMIFLQYMKPKRHMKIVAIIGAILALFFVAVTNVFAVWLLVGFFAIAILVYTLISNRFSNERNLPIFPFILSLVSLMFILANNLIGSMLANLFRMSYVDVHPTFSATMHVARFSLHNNLILGSGPNTFLKEWLIHRPDIVNSHALWDVPFSAGSSLFLTIALLGGIIGSLAVLYFLWIYGYELVKKVFKSNPNSESNFIIFGLAMLSLYFMLSLVFASPGIVITTSAFIFTGVLFGLMAGDGRMNFMSFNFLKDQRTSFFAILSIVGLLLGSAATAYVATEHLASVVFYGKSLRSAEAGDIIKADARLSQAITLVDLPVFERTRVLYAGEAVQKTLANSNENTSKDAIKNALQSAISAGSVASNRAIEIDPSDPANYLTRANFLRMIAPLKIDGVFDMAVESYTKSINIAPKYPKSYLNLAELYFDANDTKNARLYTEKAIEQKPNYTDAFFLMAQIESAEGHTKDAIKRLQDATLIDPNNPDTYFELGLLRYQGADYPDAVSAFRTTVSINPQYLNAWYYLALADNKLGNTEEAVVILEALSLRLPDNENVKNSLASIKGVSAPKQDTSSKLEKAKKLPVPSDAGNDK